MGLVVEDLFWQIFVLFNFVLESCLCFPSISELVQIYFSRKYFVVLGTMLGDGMELDIYRFACKSFVKECFWVITNVFVNELDLISGV